MTPRRLFVSFSGGETSGFMAQWALRHMAPEYDETRVLFANTGEEHEETLVFADRCDRAFGLGLEWVEAEVFPRERKAPVGRRVTFETASRNGEVFEATIAKYGIPNAASPHCTRVLKEQPMIGYLAATGWERGSYDTIIGIRPDEADRISANAKTRRILYPLISRMPMTKPKVNFWWAQQPFRLNLKGYQGNCKWCWKKSKRKHLTLLADSLGVFDFPRRMEAAYGFVGPEFAKPGHAPRRRTFFRGNRSVEDLMWEYLAGPGFTPAEDDAQAFDPDLDVGSGCGESCEVFADE